VSEIVLQRGLEFFAGKAGRNSNLVATEED